MRRHDLTKASLFVSLACMTFLGGYGVGAGLYKLVLLGLKRPRVRGSWKARKSHSNMWPPFPARPGSTTATSASLFRVDTRSSQRWSER